jgi:hypothetical protein
MTHPFSRSSVVRPLGASLPLFFSLCRFVCANNLWPASFVRRA